MTTRWVRGLVTGFVLAVVLLPIYWMAATSLKTNREITQDATLYPHAPTLNSYVLLFKDKGFSNFLTNSIVVTAASVVIAVAFGSLGAYAIARFAGVLADNLRNALFEKVGQGAARRLSGQVFRHIHDLSLRFHLERRTGSLTKIVERGTKSIDMMLYFILFNIAPTAIELIAICAIFFVKFGAGLVAATLVMVVVYITFTRVVRSASWVCTSRSVSALSALSADVGIPVGGVSARQVARAWLMSTAKDVPVVRRYSCTAVSRAEGRRTV